MAALFSGRDIVAALLAIGFVEVGQRGSHMKLRRDHRTVIVPMHREVAYGTFRSIVRQAGSTMPWPRCG
jgi:predicted RNA binding protein YcfA (HicA-like mRNA interferase family)